LLDGDGVLPESGEALLDLRLGESVLVGAEHCERRRNISVRNLDQQGRIGAVPVRDGT
jgi:hypothetical protein